MYTTVALCIFITLASCQPDPPDATPPNGKYTTYKTQITITDSPGILPIHSSTIATWNGTICLVPTTTTAPAPVAQSNPTTTTTTTAPMPIPAQGSSTGITAATSQNPQSKRRTHRTFRTRTFNPDSDQSDEIPSDGELQTLGK